MTAFNSSHSMSGSVIVENVRPDSCGQKITNTRTHIHPQTDVPNPTVEVDTHTG